MGIGDSCSAEVIDAGLSWNDSFATIEIEGVIEARCINLGVGKVLWSRNHILELGIRYSDLNLGAKLRCNDRNALQILTLLVLLLLLHKSFLGERLSLSYTLFFIEADIGVNSSLGSLTDSSACIEVLLILLMISDLLLDAGPLVLLLILMDCEWRDPRSRFDCNRLSNMT